MNGFADNPHPREDLTMALTPDELIALAPEIEELVKYLNGALKKDADGKVRVTKEERKQIGKLILGLSAKFAKEALD